VECPQYSICQVVPMCPHGRTHCRLLANTMERVHPSAHSSPHRKRQINWFSHFCTAESVYTLQWEPIATRIALPMGDLDPRSNMIPWAHASPQPKQHLNCFSRFCKMIAECPYTLQWSAHFRSKLSHPMGASGPRCNT